MNMQELIDVLSAMKDIGGNIPSYVIIVYFAYKLLCRAAKRGAGWIDSRIDRICATIETGSCLRKLEEQGLRSSDKEKK